MVSATLAADMPMYITGSNGKPDELLTLDLLLCNMPPNQEIIPAELVQRALEISAQT